MASQCAIVASDTAPVTELLQDNHNALLADFLTPTQIAAQIERVLLDPNLQKKLSANARRTIIEHYDRRQSIQQYEALLSRLGCSADSR
jgi:glycosyltransferase involved in cell wall biosynthesis